MKTGKIPFPHGILRHSQRGRQTCGCHTQRGVSMAISLIFLLLISIIGISTMRTAILEQRMAQNSNSSDTLLAYAAAEFALYQARKSFESTTIPKYFANYSSDRINKLTTPVFVPQPYDHLIGDGEAVSPSALIEDTTSVFTNSCTNGLCSNNDPWSGLLTLASVSRVAIPSTTNLQNVAEQPSYVIEYLPGISEIARNYMGFHQFTDLTDVEPISYRERKMLIPANTPGIDTTQRTATPVTMPTALADYKYVKSCWDTYGYWQIPGQTLSLNACTFDRALATNTGEVMNYWHYRDQTSRKRYTGAINLLASSPPATFEGPTDPQGWKLPRTGTTTPTPAAGQLTRANQGQVYLVDDTDCVFTSNAGDQILGLPNCELPATALDSTFPFIFLRPNYRYRSYYRVTAVGTGIRSTTRVIMQQIFYREIYQWNSVTRTEALTAASNFNTPLASCDYPLNRGYSSSSASTTGFIGYAYPPSHINASKERMAPGHAKSYFWTGRAATTAGGTDNRCSHWLGAEDLKWRMPSNATAKFIWMNPDTVKYFPPVVIQSVQG